MTRQVMQRLGDETLAAIVVRMSDWPRRFMGGLLIPDTWMALVETRDGRRWILPAGDEPRAAAEDTLTLVRNRAFTVPIDTRETESADGNMVGGTADVLIRWPMNDADLASLRRKLLPHGELSLQALADAFADGGARSSLQRFIRANDAKTLIDNDHRADFHTHLVREMQHFCFESGLTIEQVPMLKLGSSTLARRQAMQRDAIGEVERIQSRELVEQAAISATRKRLDDLTGVMEKLQSAVARGPDNMQWHELLPALSPAERGRLLENLWRITPDRRRTSAIVAVAGDECVWIDPAAPENILRRVKLPHDLGGARSISFDVANRWLLVGAATGIWALHADDGSIAARFSIPDVAKPKTGFNSTLVADRVLYATHSTLGFWRWNLADGLPECILAPEDGTPRTIRSACVAVDGRVLFAADDCVHAYVPASRSLETVAVADDTIHAIAANGFEIFAGVADGKLLRLDLRQPEDWWVPYRTNIPIESVQSRQWSDLVELIVPAGAQGVVGIYGEQNVVTRLMETPTAARRAWAADDLVVALNDRRDRLTFMRSDSPTRQGQELALSRVLGSSIQDICLVTDAI